MRDGFGFATGLATGFAAFFFEGEGLGGFGFSSFACKIDQIVIGSSAV